MPNNTQQTPPRATSALWMRILLLIAGFGVLAGVIYYFGFVRIYKSDYARTLEGVNRTTTAYNTLLGARDTAISSLGKDESTFTAAVDTYRKDYSSYVTADASLDNKRTMRNPSVRAAYKALQERNTKFATFVSRQLTLLPLVQGVVTTCTESVPSKLNTSDLSKIVEVYDAAFGTCTAAMKSLAKSDTTAAAKRGSDAAAYFDGMRAHAVAMQTAYSAGSRATFESEYNALLESLAQYKTHLQVRDLLDIDKDVVPTAELNTLAKTLGDLQR